MLHWQSSYFKTKQHPTSMQYQQTCTFITKKIVEVLPCVACVFFEGKSKDGDFLVGDCVEQTLDDSVGEASLLILIDVNHLLKK